MAESSRVHASPRWSLKGMTALVELVEELAGFGAFVYTCSRNQAKFDKCLKEWNAKGFSVTGQLCDVAVKSDRESLINQVSVSFDGKLNILVKNVGTNIRKPTTEYTSEEYSFIMSANLDSTYHLCQLAHPLLKASGVGSIVFNSSVAGLVHLGSGAIYAATKVAINQLTKSLACEWGERQYSEQCCCSMLLENNKFVEDVASRTPLNRVAAGSFIHHRTVFAPLVFPNEPTS